MPTAATERSARAGGSGAGAAAGGLPDLDPLAHRAIQRRQHLDAGERQRARRRIARELGEPQLALDRLAAARAARGEPRHPLLTDHRQAVAAGRTSPGPASRSPISMPTIRRIAASGTRRASGGVQRDGRLGGLRRRAHRRDGRQRERGRETGRPRGRVSVSPAHSPPPSARTAGTRRPLG
jgi:hypothetical protein